MDFFVGWPAEFPQYLSASYWHDLPPPPKMLLTPLEKEMRAF